MPIRIVTFAPGVPGQDRTRLASEITPTAITASTSPAVSAAQEAP
jgi:hypothetical protein